MTRLLPLLLLALALPIVAEEKPAQETEKPKHTLRWSTASEVENFGFDVYRAEKEEGPFERITKEPIPGAGTVDEPSYYQYADEAIDPTKTYWYYVESISTRGEREQFTPIYKAGPKSGPKPEPKQEPETEKSEDGEGSG